MPAYRICPTCGRLSQTRYCPDHTRRYGYNDSHWQRIRQARLLIDAGQCQLAHPGCTQTATTVHLDPSLNGDHRQATVTNTVSACRHCHGVTDGSRTATTRRNNQRPPQRG
jgi:5-methylcytosine-specific restriction endonuclease McrA